MEFPEAAKKDPPFAPVVVPKFREKPRIPPLQPHDRAAKYRREIIQRRKSKDDPQQVSLQSWILYMIRFIFTSDLRGAWSSLGGISAKFSHLSLVLHLAVTETADYAIAYDFELRRLIDRMARRRESSSDPTKLLCEENEDIVRYLNVDLGNGRANNQTNVSNANDKFGKNANAPHPAALPPPQTGGLTELGRAIEPGLRARITNLMISHRLVLRLRAKDAEISLGKNSVRKVWGGGYRLPPPPP